MCVCVCCRAQAKRPPLCTILSMSQRLRSLKITRRDRRGLRLIFFHSPLFVIRCQQNFLGAQTTAFMSGVSHGLTARRAAHSNTRAKRPAKAQVHNVCLESGRTSADPYLSGHSDTRSGKGHFLYSFRIKSAEKVFFTSVS